MVKIDETEIAIGDIAIFNHPGNGYRFNTEQAKKLLRIGQPYTIQGVNQGEEDTIVWLRGIERVGFKSVQFDFYHEE